MADGPVGGTPAMTPLRTLADDLDAGRTTSRNLVEQALARIGDPAGEGARVMLKVDEDAARAAADESDRLRAAGIDFPLPSPEQLNQGNPPEDIHLNLDVSGQLETKMACILCHRTQVAPDWPYHLVSRDVAEWVLGREYYIRARPEVASGETVPEDIFDGIAPD